MDMPDALVLQLINSSYVKVFRAVIELPYFLRFFIFIYICVVSYLSE